MMLRNFKRLGLVGCAVACALLANGRVGNEAQAATITWFNPGSGVWSDTNNWADPGNPSSAPPDATSNVEFTDDDAGFTTTMDLGASTTIASYEILPNTDAAVHTTALGSNSLTMTDMTLANSPSGTPYYANLDITGDPGAKLNIQGTLLMATGRGSQSTLTIDPDVELNIGIDANNRGVLQVIRDTSPSFALNRATLTAGNSFNAYLSSMIVGAEGTSQGETQANRAILDLSAVTSGVLDVSGSVQIGEGYAAAGQVTVSDDVDVKIGVDASNRGSLRISAGPGKESDHFASFMNLGTGTFEAFLTELSVGYTTETSTYTGTIAADTSFGTLDASNVTDGFIDVDGTVRIGTVIQGVGRGDSGAITGTPIPASAEGTVKLGAFNVNAVDLEVGDADNDGGFGRLELNGTVFSVSDSVSIDGDSVANQGVVSIVVGGTSAGLSLGSSATLTVGEGLIELLFEGPVPDLLDEPYWGFRWDGDHVSELHSLFNNGKLVIDDGGVGDSVGIFFLGGVTYVGIAPVPEPSSVLLLGLGMLGLVMRSRRRRRIDG